MYRVLEAEMVLNDVSRKDIAEALGVTIGTLSPKLNDKAPITLHEARTIKERVGTSKTIDELFKEE